MPLAQDQDQDQDQDEQQEEQKEEQKKEQKKESKLFTQDEVNSFLAREQRKIEERAKKTNEKTIKQLEELQKTHGLTEEEKQNLERRIEDIRNEYLTKEQIEKKRQKEEAEKTKKEQENLTKDRDRWKTMYEQSTVDRDIIDAAIKGDAFNPEQVLSILKPLTRLVEELDEENKPTGRFFPKVRFAGKDKDGKTVVLDLTATDAVKQMKEMSDLYGNLFKSGAHGGVGGNNQGRSSNLGGPPLNDAAAYRQWRKQSTARR